MQQPATVPFVAPLQPTSEYTRLRRYLMQSVIVNDTENRAFAISVHSDTVRHYKTDEGKYILNILPFLMDIFMENRYMH
jgi:hypothetical protein